MVSISQLSQALKEMSIQCLGDNLIIFDNDVVDPSGVEKFYRCSLIVGDAEHSGKQYQNPEFVHGIYQISCYVKINTGMYDIEQIADIDMIRQFFKQRTSQSLSMLRITAGNKRAIDGWFARDVSIYFTAK